MKNFNYCVLCFVMSFVFSSAQWLVQDPNLCQTPSLQRGQCVSLKSCAIAVELVISQDPINLAYVRSLRCGQVGERPSKVCCPFSASALENNDLTEITTTTLTYLNLGEWEGLNPVPKCSTPRNELGECINIKNCPRALVLLRSRDQADLNYLRNLQCGFDGPRTPKVCCTNSTSQPSNVFEPPDTSDHPNIGKINSRMCGNTNIDKIVGGNSTGLYDYPWMALISYITERGREFKCGGTLIHEEYVLTAAHCLTNLKSGNSLAGVRLGEHNISSKVDCHISYGGNGIKIEDCAPPVQDIKIASTIIHPEYNPKNFSTPDIGLIRLQKKADLTRRNIKPVCLPVDDLRNFTSSIAIVAGWGTTETGLGSDVLLQVRLPILTNEQCRDIYKNNPSITYRQVCAGGQQSEGHDACGGDSGGPLMSPEAVNGEPKFVQHAIVSFGPRFCGFDSRPGVYTRVAFYMNWILDNLSS